MFRQSVQLLFKSKLRWDEQTKRGRVVGPSPLGDIYHGRKPEYLQRFKEMGPRNNKRWVSLGAGAKGKRLGRSRERMDRLLMWRPIERGIQMLYQSQMKTRRYGARIPLQPSRGERLQQDYYMTGGFANAPYQKGRTYADKAPYYPHDFEYRAL